MLVFASLVNATTTAAGNSADLGTGVQLNTMQVANNGFTTWQVNLEGSLDGTHWATLATLTNGQGDIITSSQHLVRFVRANFISATGTGTLTAGIISNKNPLTGLAQYLT